MRTCTTKCQGLIYHPRPLQVDVGCGGTFRRSLHLRRRPTQLLHHRSGGRRSDFRCAIREWLKCVASGVCKVRLDEMQCLIVVHTLLAGLYFLVKTAEFVLSPVASVFAQQNINLFRLHWSRPTDLIFNQEWGECFRALRI